MTRFHGQDERCSVSGEIFDVEGFCRLLNIDTTMAFLGLAVLEIAVARQ